MSRYLRARENRSVSYGVTGRRIARCFLVVSLAFLSACSTMHPEDFTAQTPTFKPEEFFAGKTKGQGLFYDRFRNMRTSFTVDLDGSWNGSQLILNEDLRYADGTRTKRTFTITKQSDHLYEVTMPDLVGPGRIEAYGNCIRWSYKLRQDINGSVWTLTFDDWMFLQDGNLVLNRAYATKFGFDVGEVIMAVRKSDVPEG